MPTYQYEARDNAGKMVKGKMESRSQTAVATDLFKKGLTPISVYQVNTRASLKGLMAFEITPKRVKPDDMIMFCRQMYSLTKAGVPILNSLTRLAETNRSSILKQSLLAVTEKIAAGQSLTSAMSKYPKVFSNVFTSLIEAGEQSGQLETAFEQLAAYFELEQRTKKQIKSATRYPMIVIVTIILAMMIINFFVIPAFAKMFASFNAELPAVTRGLLGMSNFLLSNWPYLLVLVIILVAAWVAYLKTEKGRLRWDYIKLKMPIIGSIVHRVIMARFARVFTMILRSGVPLVHGIGLVSNTIGNAYVAKQMGLIQSGVEKGESLSKTAQESGLFTPISLQMLAVGEEAGAVDEMLLEVADYYEREVDYDLSRLSELIEPIMLIIVGVMVLILALGVFLPMWNMASFAMK